jgi:hypothetical protein
MPTFGSVATLLAPPGAACNAAKYHCQSSTNVENLIVRDYY